MCKRLLNRKPKDTKTTSDSLDAQATGDPKPKGESPTDQIARSQLTPANLGVIRPLDVSTLLLILSFAISGMSFLADLSQIILLPYPFPYVVAFGLALMAAILFMLMRKDWVRWVLGGLVTVSVVIFSSWFGNALRLGRFEPIFLAERVETFQFDAGTTDDWKPLEHNPGWMTYAKTGDLAVTSVTSLSRSRCSNQTGQLLKYPLYLQSKKLENGGFYTSRNAIYKPTDGAKVAGIIANVCLTGDPGFSGRQIIGGFIAEDKTRIHESDTWTLEPNTWNTLVWSMNSPHYWAPGEQKDAKWQALKETFPANEQNNLFVYQRLDRTGIDRIGIQFYVWPDGDSTEFKGTAYFDNIVIVYANP